MARIAVLDDYEGHAHIFSAPLKLAGHSVVEEVTPIDWEKVVNFAPEVICLVLYRNRTAFNRPIQDPLQDILGYMAIQEVENYPAIQLVPILLVGNAVEEADIPSTINYDLFLTFPEDISAYLPRLEELALKVKTRRKISSYACPKCRSRLVFIKEPAKDLFCPRCYTSVSLIDEQHCLVVDGGVGLSSHCDVADLTPTSRLYEAPNRPGRQL